MDFVRPQSGVQATETTTTPPASPEAPREPVRQEAPKPKKKHTVFKMAVLVLLLFGALGGLGYLYYQQKTDNDTLLLENANLKGATTASVPTAAGSDGDALAADTKYIAKVGKFQLSLDRKYTVIRQLDGEFEGGPATQLEIATTLTEKDQYNVVAAPILDKIIVFAKPLTESESFDQFVKSDIADRSVTKDKDMTVGGVAAQAYRVDGSSIGKTVYFTSKGIAYRVSTDNIEGTNVQKAFQDVIGGLKFN